MATAAMTACDDDDSAPEPQNDAASTTNDAASTTNDASDAGNDAADAQSDASTGEDAAKDDCQNACQGEKPYCFMAQCVQCRTKDDCSDGQSCSDDHSCLAPAACDHSGFERTSDRIEKASDGALTYSAQSAKAADGTSDQLQLTLKAPLSMTPGTYALGNNAQELDPARCERCLTISSGCNEGANCQKRYLATAGQMQITALGLNPGQQTQIALSDVTLTELKTDAQGQSQPDASGAHWCLPAYSLQIAMPGDATHCGSDDDCRESADGPHCKDGACLPCTSNDHCEAYEVCKQNHCINRNLEHWNCNPQKYGDGICDCGCGDYDTDCRDHLASSCQSLTGCTAFAGQQVYSDDNSKCIPACTEETAPQICEHGFKHCDGSLCIECFSAYHCWPETSGEHEQYCDAGRCVDPHGWTCGAEYYGDGFCDCGCGVRDIDCQGDTIDFCDTKIGCQDFAAQIPNETENWTCTERCTEQNAAQICRNGWHHCQNDVCVECRDSNDCPYHEACENNRCIHDTPRGWSCGDYPYGDGKCTCGCHVKDKDCLGDSSDLCEDNRCNGGRKRLADQNWLCDAACTPSDEAQTCPNKESPHCSPIGECAECANDTHCAQNRWHKLCDPHQYSCIECDDDDDCNNGSCKGGICYSEGECNRTGYPIKGGEFGYRNGTPILTLYSDDSDQGGYLTFPLSDTQVPGPGSYTVHQDRSVSEFDSPLPIVLYYNCVGFDCTPFLAYEATLTMEIMERNHYKGSLSNMKLKETYVTAFPDEHDHDPVPSHTWCIDRIDFDLTENAGER